jgi:GT2 family glycosyltransferase
MMKSTYLITIVNYNNWEDTAECIQSLKVANIDSENICIIDNASTNDSITKLKMYSPDIELIVNEKNVGFSTANNIGIKKALERNLDYIILLNNDTVVEKLAINKIIINMDKNIDVSVGTGQIRYYDDRTMIWYAGGKLIPWRASAKHFYKNKNVLDFSKIEKSREVSFISGCFMCIRVKDVLTVGYLSNSFFLYLEDIEYSARFVRNKLKMYYFADSLIYHKCRGEQKYNSRVLYYSVRNRKLLIELAFNKFAKYYYNIVIYLKIIIWFLIKKEFYYAAIKGLNDYSKKYFGVYDN